MTLVGFLIASGLISFSLWCLATYDTEERRDRKWARRHKI